MDANLVQSKVEQYDCVVKSDECKMLRGVLCGCISAKKVGSNSATSSSCYESNTFPS